MKNRILYYGLIVILGIVLIWCSENRSLRWAYAATERQDQDAGPRLMYFDCYDHDDDPVGNLACSSFSVALKAHPDWARRVQIAPSRLRSGQGSNKEVHHIATAHGTAVFLLSPVDNNEYANVGRGGGIGYYGPPHIHEIRDKYEMLKWTEREMDCWANSAKGALSSSCIEGETYRSNW